MVAAGWAQPYCRAAGQEKKKIFMQKSRSAMVSHSQNGISFLI
ncbi:hypothetical protein [uncultured Megasphaera sp.]|nr:hypothetical protein [uncultured Megasphaera sp.]